MYCGHWWRVTTIKGVAFNQVNMACCRRHNLNPLLTLAYLACIWNKLPNRTYILNYSIIKPGVSQLWANTYLCVCVCLCLCVFVFVCVSAAEVISNLTSYDCLRKFYSFYMAAVVSIISRHL